MAADLKLNAGDVSGKYLRNASEDLENAKNKLASLDSYGFMQNARYETAVGQFPLFPAWMAETAAEISREIASVRSVLQGMAGILDTAPDELEQIDASQKNKISSWGERTAYHADNFFSGLFSSEKSKTGKRTWIGATEAEREEALKKYDWSRVPVTENEINQIMEDETLSKEELEEQLDKLYAEKAKGRYISQREPQKQYWGSYYDEYYFDIFNYGCYVSSISMALSSLGKDVLPKEICLINQTYEPDNPTNCYIYSIAREFDCDVLLPNLDQALQNYQNNPKKYSPPIVWTGSHYVVVLAKNDDGSLLVRDPGVAGDYSPQYLNDNIVEVFQFYVSGEE